MRWTPPWPPILVGDGEWIVMRDSHHRPAAVIRALRLGPRQELLFRAVTWAVLSQGRELIGYFPTLEEADQAVLFTPGGGAVSGGVNGDRGDGPALAAKRR